MKQGANQKNKSLYDRCKRNVLRCCLNIASDNTDFTCNGRLFQKLAPETGKARLPTAERLNGGTASRLEEVDRSLLQAGALSFKARKYQYRYHHSESPYLPRTNERLS